MINYNEEFLYRNDMDFSFKQLQTMLRNRICTGLNVKGALVSESEEKLYIPKYLRLKLLLPTILLLAELFTLLFSVLYIINYSNYYTIS